MRSVDTAYADALTNAPEKGLVVVALISILAYDVEEETEERFGFSTEVDTYDFDVVSAETGSTVSRTYVGGGTVLDVEPVKLATGLGIKQWSCTLSLLQPEVELMARGRRVRGQPIELHLAVFDPVTRAQVGAPLVDFEGIVNDADFSGASAGGEGGVTLSCFGQTIELTRANFATRSDATIRQRTGTAAPAGDALGQYLGAMGNVKVPWGQEGESGKKGSSDPFRPAGSGSNTSGVSR